jgi:outer membrane immunogenic protein
MRASARAYLLSTASSIALMGAAAAADLRMPVKAPVVPPPSPTWTGAYIGLNAGVAWHRWRFIDVDNAAGLIPNTGLGTLVNNEFWSDRQAAFMLGGQIGYNWQSGNIVYGFEGDLNWIDANRDAIFRRPNSATDFTTASTKLDWIGTLRGRLGVTFSPTMVYLTGGLAVVHTKDFISINFFGNPATNVASGRTRATWVAGVGAEHRLSPDWSVKLEALAVGQSAETVAFPQFGNTYRSEFKHSLALLRLGVNRRLPPN